MSGIRVAIAAIVKNEGPYLLEWIAWHRVLGFDHFLIADNDSDDGSSDLLADLHNAGIITHIPFPGKAGKSPQAAAYTHIFDMHSHAFDWIAVIDADEFMFPSQPSFNIGSFLSSVPEDVGAIALNWAVYGSSGASLRAPGLVIERFQRRASMGHPLNNQVKSMARTNAYLGMHDSHLFEISEGYKYTDCGLKPLVVLHDRQRARVSTIKWEPLRVNHYVVKSLAEFVVKKRARGRAKVVGSLREMNFFKQHDQNEEFEPVPTQLLGRVYAEIQALSAKTRGYSDEAFWPIDADAMLESYFDREQPWLGTIDSITIRRSGLFISGWAVANDGHPAPDFTFHIGDIRLPVAEITRKDRPDVVAALVSKGRSSLKRNLGFTLRVPASSAEALRARECGGEWVARATDSSGAVGADLSVPKSFLIPGK